MNKKQKANFPNEKLTNGDVIERFRLLNAPNDLQGFDICYPKDRNLEKLRLAIKYNKLDQKDQIPPAEDYKAYEKDLSDLFKKISLKDDGSHRLKIIRDFQGNEQEVFDVDVNGDEYLSGKALLNLKHAAALEGRQAQFNEYEEFLEKPFAGDIKLHYIASSLVRQTNPNISNRSMRSISWMITEDE